MGSFDERRDEGGRKEQVEGERGEVMSSMGKSLEIASQSWIPITPHVDTELVISAISQAVKVLSCA